LLLADAALAFPRANLPGHTDAEYGLSSQNISTPGTLPTYIPWIHGHACEKAFLCDVMVEGLARQMRLFGIDAASMPQLPKHQRHQTIRCGLQRDDGAHALGCAHMRSLD
jgi:hypothetical protein